MTRRESIAICALVCLASRGFAAVSNVVVSGVTNTQAVLQYTAPGYTACTVEVSESPAYVPLNFDVDATKFTNASTDLLRTSTVVSGRTRTVVLGRRVAAHALDGWVRSRALQQNAAHYYRITCGTDVATGTFNTVPIPLGNTYNEPIPGDPNDPEHPLWPQLDWRDRSQTVIDPQTGVLLKLLSFPGESPFALSSNPWSFDNSYGPSWTNASAANASSGAGASISGSTVPLVLVLNAGFSFSAINVQITCAIGGGATGDDAKGQVAISRNGAVAYGPWKDFTCPSTMSTSQMVGDSVTLNAPNSLGYMPTWIDANGGQTPIRFGLNPGPIGLTISGATVTTTNTAQGFSPFSVPNQLVYMNTSGGYRPFTIASMGANFHSVTMTSPITGTWAGNSTITSISATFPAVITTAGPHLFTTGDGVNINGVGGLDPNVTWSAIVLSATTFEIKDSHGNFFDGRNAFGCCVSAVLTSVPVMDLPSLYFLVRKKTASANTMNFYAQYNIIPEDTIPFNGGSGGLEHCPPRGVPDGMYIGAIDASGNVAFAQPTHGFTIGSSVAITLGGTTPTSVDGNYTANIVDNSHAQINSWSHGAWSGDGYMFQPGAKIGYLCWILTGGGGSLMQNIFTDGEVRNLGALFLANGDIASTPSSVFPDVTKNPYLTYLRAYSAGVQNGVFAGTFWPRTRDMGQNQAGYAPPWQSLATHVLDAIHTFDPRIPAGFGFNSIALANHDYFIMSGTYGAQDTAAWSVVLNNAGVPVASDSTFSTRPVRYAGQHGIGGARKDNLVIRAFHSAYSFDQFYNGPWKFTLLSQMNGPPFDDCGTLAPGNILTEPPFPATGPHCTLVTVNTTTPVAGIPAGEHDAGQLKIGDIVDCQGEYCRVAAVPDSTHVVFQRRFSNDHYNASSCSQAGRPADCSWSHAPGTVFSMPQGESDYANAPYHTDDGALAWWDFIADPLGLNAADPAGQGLSTATKYFESAFPTASHFDWKDHVFLNDSGGDVTVGWPRALPDNGKIDGVRICPGSNQRVNCSVFTVNGNPAFSGTIGAAYGNFGDQHPSIVSPDPLFFPNNAVTGLPLFPFYMDFQTTGVIGDGTTRAAILAPGATQVYKLLTGDTADNKRMPLDVVSGPYQLTDASAPGKVLHDNSTDQYKYCIVAIAGECWAGSVVGERYANAPYVVVPPAVTGVNNVTCYPTTLDLCAWVLGAHQGKFAQLGMQRQDRLGNDSRGLTWGLEYYRRGGGNTRILPSGDWELIQGNAGGINTPMLLAKIGTFPAYSSVNRTDFISVPVQIASRPGATAAVIDYGFDENFRCSSRADGCVATGNASTAPNPYYWASETYTGAACSAGCKINIPAIGGRTVYYRTRYLNSSGATIVTGKTIVIAVP